MNPVNVFWSFIGKWSLERVIISTSGNKLAQAKGTSSFEIYKDNQNHLVYHENGVLTLSDQNPLSFRKEYHYCLSDQKISLFFDRELRNLYHTIDFASKVGPMGIHFCSPDKYETTYKFYSSTNYETQCKVSGPNKDYIIHSIYKKLVESNM